MYNIIFADINNYNSDDIYISLQVVLTRFCIPSWGTRWEDIVRTAWVGDIGNCLEEDRGRIEQDRVVGIDIVVDIVGDIVEERMFVVDVLCYRYIAVSKEGHLPAYLLSSPVCSSSIS